jgi:murein DD-endopeptidase MepM/ murein hydrolase activator NlpD
MPAQPLGPLGGIKGMRTSNRLPALCLFALVCAPAGAVTATFSPAQPIIEPTQKGLELNFDLQVKNDSPGPITLTKLEIGYFDPQGQEILRRELNGSGSAPNIETIAQRRIDAGAEWLFFNPFPELPANLEPRVIKARLSFAAEGGKTTEVSLQTTVSPRGPMALVLPLAGRIRDWDGHDALSHHRRWNHSLPFLRGLGFASNGMRYAHDFLRVEGETFGAPVLAAADGTVVRVVMDRPDDRSFDPQTSLADSNALFGNYVVIDHGGAYSLYGHLRQHSSTLALGARVKAGQPIAAVGLSGSAEFPHLHFQLMDAPDMRGEGLPSLFRNFSRIRGERLLRVKEGPIASGELVEAYGSRK